MAFSVSSNADICDANLRLAYPDGGNWQRNFRQIKAKLRKDIKNRLNEEIAEEVEDQSYVIIGDIPGLHGGRLKVVWRRADPQINPSHRRDYFRGNPHWFVDLVGPEIAAYFGYWILSKDIMLIPNATEATVAIAKLNRAVEPSDRISVTFYEPKSNRVSNDEFGIRFGSMSGPELPIALTGDQAMHDISYHFSMILMPVEASTVISAQHRAISEFYRFVKSHYLDSDDIFKIRHPSMVDDVITSGIWRDVQDLGRRADYISGSLILGLGPTVPAAARMVPSPIVDFVYKNAFTYRSRDVKSAKQLLQALHMNESRNTQHMSEALADFSAIRSANDPHFETEFFLSESQFDKRIRARVRDISTTVRRIQSLAN